jgi:hypothetical protein
MTAKRKSSTSAPLDADKAAKLSGPLFSPATDKHRESVLWKAGGHYNIFKTSSPRAALAMLREWFPEEQSIDEMNIVLFSTSGVHGDYLTIEEIEADIKKYGRSKSLEDDYRRPAREVTFLLVQPRLVSMTYGNVACETKADVAFLKKLRDRSWKAVQIICAP